MAYTKTRIKLRNDTTANWVTNDPVLLQGEFAFDTTTKYIKIGDGTSKWSELSTVRLPKTAIDNLQDVNTNTIYELSTSTDGNTVTLMSADGTLATPEFATTGTSFSIASLSSKVYDLEQAVDTLNGDDSTAGSVAKSIKDAIEALDVDPLTGSASKTLTSVSEVDGKLTADYADIQLTGIGQVTNLETTILSAKSDAIDAANAYTDGVSAALSTDYVAKIGAAQEAAETSAQTVRDDLTAYVKYTDVNGGSAVLTGDNKVATLKDVADLGSVTYLLGNIANDEATSGETDKLVIVDTYGATAKRGAIVINTANSKEYLCVAAVDASSITVDDWIELGDEGLYETKADAQEKLVEAKTYTDASISALTYADATAEAHKFVTKVTETSGVISVERAALTYDDLPASDLSAHFDYIGAASEAEATAKSYSDELSVSLSTEVSAQLATKLDASAVVNKLALSSLADITTELDDDYVTEVYCGSTAKTTVVGGQKVVVLSALAFKDTVGTSDIDDGAVTNAKIADESVTEAKLSGLFVWDCGGAADPA